MNRRLLTSLLILVCSSLIVNECYAWPPEPDVYISDWEKYTTIGEDVEVYAEVDNCDVAGPIADWDWTKPSGLYFSDTPVENDCNSTATFWSDTPGQYEVVAKGTDEYGQWDDDWAYVYVIDVEIDTPSSFPAYVELGENLSLGSTLTPASAGGGTYSWTKVTGPGTVTFSPSAGAEDPNFSADQPGNYTVKVTYTKGGATCSDTSGTITVFKVEIDTPSSFPAYIALGDTLALGSTVLPASAGTGTYSWTKVSGPGTVTFSPSASAEDPNFSANQPGNYTVKVEYTKGCTTASDTSGTITVFDVEIDTPSSFPAYVELGENLSLGSTLTPASAGGGSYSWLKVSGPGTVTFSPSANAEDPTFSANQSGNYTVKVEYTKGSATASDTSGTITVYETEFKSIKFTSDHGVLNDNDSDWTDSGTTYSEPEWIAAPATNNPISHTKNASLTVSVTVKVRPSGLNFDLIGDGPNNYVDFNEPNLTSTGADQVATITADAKLPNLVDTLTKSITWTIKLTDPYPNIVENVGTSGAHKIYVTYGTPSGSVVTEKRMSWACQKADGATSPSTVASGIHNALGNVDPPYEPGEKPSSGSGWPLLAGTTYGECDEQAGLMELAVEMLGVTGEVKLVRASTNAGAGNCLDQESKTESGIKKWLILDFDTGAGHNWNAFEGCCVTAGFYYAVWPKHKATDDYDMLKNKLAPQQYWVKTYLDIPPGSSGWGVETVYAEEALP